MSFKSKGFTIVELLIVIVVIGILAAISIVAYSGVQQRARDTKRLQDIQAITKALDLYYVDNGEFPPGQCTVNCSINSGWSSTADGSWSNLRSRLVPKYISDLPEDPINTSRGASQAPWSDATTYHYSYFAGAAPYCGKTSSTPRSIYVLVYRLEGSTQKQQTETCAATALGPFSGSNVRVVK